MKRNQLILTPAQWRLSIIGELIHRDPNDHRTQEERLDELDPRRKGLSLAGWASQCFRSPFPRRLLAVSDVLATGFPIFRINA